MFGHRRLAILDLSPAGHQPMVSTDGRYGVVFNGCIYNFREIRTDLEREGEIFRSQCDTEVLLVGAIRWGVAAIAQRLRGMFAFAFWDSKCKSLCLVRDRLGVKPLCYTVGSSGIAFASTPGALRTAGYGKELNRESLLEFLEFGFVTDQRSVWTNIEKLPPATILNWNRGELSMSTYWQWPMMNEGLKISFPDAVDETERLLKDSVRLRLISDVPAAALLSGGIDSSLICWAMAEANAKTRAFTVSVPGQSVDETEAARRTAQTLGISHESVILPPESSNSIDELLSAFSEPFASSSALGVLGVSRAIKPQATVLLTGDGGDEAFLGYPYFRSFWRATRLARFLPNGAPSIWEKARPFFAALPASRRPKHLFDFATGGLGAVTRTRDGLDFFERHRLLGEAFAGTRLAQRDIPRSMEAARRLLSQALPYHYRTWLIGEFNVKVDGGTMYHGLEARAPFLDHVLWDFAARLPPRVQFHGGHLKAILREIVRRRISPQLSSQPKYGFRIPVERWLVTRWRKELASLPMDNVLVSHGLIAPGSLDGVVSRYLRQEEAPHQLWYLLVLDRWLRRQSSV